MTGRLLFASLTQLLFINLSIAQGNYTSSERFILYYKNYHLLNPANADTSYLFDFKIGNKSQTGLFKGVRNIYADIDLSINKQKDKNRNYLGFQFLNRKEGEFISKNRIYLRYGIRLQLKENTIASVGIMGGLVNYTFRSSQAGAGGSSTVPDINIGAWYLWKNFGFGFSGQQLLNSQLSPVVQKFQLTRYYNFTLFNNIRFTDEIYFAPHFYYNYQNRENNSLSLAGIFHFNDLIEAGGGFTFKSGFHLQIGLNSFFTRYGDVQFNFSYWVPYSSPGISDNSLELFAGWKNN